jgi:hypothetical protein
LQKDTDSARIGFGLYLKNPLYRSSAFEFAFEFPRAWIWKHNKPYQEGVGTIYKIPNKKKAVNKSIFF